MSFIDLLVAACYKSRWNFDLFTAAVMLYFVASVRYEQSRLNGTTPDTFLCAGDHDLFRMVQEIYGEIAELGSAASGAETRQLIQKTKQQIAPLYHTGLLNSEMKNMYHHIAVEI